MAKRSEPSGPQPKQFRGIDEIDQAIAKLKRRLLELEGLQGLNHRDPRINNAEENVRKAILEIYGTNSPEHNAHYHFELEYGPLRIGMPEAAWQQRFVQGLPRGIATVQNLISGLEEKRAEFESEPTVQAHLTFEGRRFNPLIAFAARQLFADGHYAEAVFGAAKTLIDLVKQKSGRHDLDGAPLMRAVFSKNNPVLAFNDLRDQTDADEQEGMMHLYEGAVLGVRNVRGHKPGVKDESGRALQYLELLSLLADRVDETIKR